MEGVGGSPLCAFLTPGVMQFLGGGQLTAIDLLRTIHCYSLSWQRDKNTKEEDAVQFLWSITLDQAV